MTSSLPFKDAPDVWLGWRNDSLGGAPVSIEFALDNLRNLSRVEVQANNQHSRDVRVSTSRLQGDRDRPSGEGERPSRTIWRSARFHPRLL